MLELTKRENTGIIQNFFFFLSKAEPEPGMTAGQVLPVQYRTYHGRLQPPVKPLFGLEPEP